MTRFTSPLDNIRVASPCSADWDRMIGNERMRFCGECKLNVYNLSAMTREEAERLIVNAEGRLCARFYKRADGSVITKNCPVGWRAVKARVTRVCTAAASLIFTFIAGFGINSLFSGSEEFCELPAKIERPQQIPDPDITMGAVAPDFRDPGLMGEVAIEPEDVVVGRVSHED